MYLQLLPSQGCTKPSLRIPYWTHCYGIPLYRIYIPNLDILQGCLSLWLIVLLVFGAVD